MTKDVREAVIKHIEQNCLAKKIYLKSINGYLEHIHCLISLSKDQSIAQVAQLIKGESAHWMNTNLELPQKIVWQDDYFAVSVGESQLSAVVKYIENQEAHHRGKPFSEEVREFNQKYGF